ncbi:hypothetical protein IPG36_07325 [bacterium]|nr:MAG: hypothetical protein IPG36_07325 [bacterium]
MTLLVLVERATLDRITALPLVVGDFLGTAQQQLLEEIASRLGKATLTPVSDIVVVQHVGLPRASDLALVRNLVHIHQPDEMVLVFDSSAPHDHHVTERLMLPRLIVRCWQLAVEDDVFYLQDFIRPPIATEAIRRA